MSTDIFLYVERRTGEAWEFVPPPERDLKRWPVTERDRRVSLHNYEEWGPGMVTAQCDGPIVDFAEIGCQGPTCPRCAGTGRNPRWYREQSYVVFGVLAGVRRADLPRIADPRGVPADLSAAVAGCARWEHDMSWLLLSEVLTFRWDELLVEWQPRHPEVSTFTTFIDQFVLPLLPVEFHELRSVLEDAVEEQHGSETRDQWMTAPVDDARISALRSSALGLASSIRFVFGFSS